MANLNKITVTGNLAADPQLNTTQSGAQVAGFRMAHTPKRMDPQTKQWVEGDTVWYDCSAWNYAAGKVIANLTKGQRVTVEGRPRIKTFEKKDGTTGAVIGIDIQEVWPEIYAPRDDQPQQQPQQGGWQNQQQAPQQRQGGFGGQQQQMSNDPWGSAPQQTSQPGQDEPPF